MDCSKTEIFFKEWNRMCGASSIRGTSTCPMKVSKITSLCSECRGGVCANQERAIKIVQEWSDANPPKTRLSVLKKHFPNYRRVEGHGEEPEICAEDLFGINCPYPIPDDGVCLKCWNTPIEEE